MRTINHNFEDIHTKALVLERRYRNISLHLCYRLLLFIDSLMRLCKLYYQINYHLLFLRMKFELGFGLAIWNIISDVLVLPNWSRGSRHCRKSNLKTFRERYHGGRNISIYLHLKFKGDLKRWNISFLWWIFSIPTNYLTLNLFYVK